jgi:predicted nucleic acid-binding protein
MLWMAECVSAIRSSVYAGRITAEQGRVAVEDLFALEVELVPLSIPLSRQAFAWAGRIGQSRAYDGFYLALAEDLSAEFWSADRRLVNAAQQAGAPWAHWIGELVEAGG